MNCCSQDNSTPAELSSAQPIAQQESIGEQLAEPTGTTAQTGSVEQAEPVFEPVEIPIPPKVSYNMNIWQIIVEKLAYDF